MAAKQPAIANLIAAHQFPSPTSLEPSLDEVFLTSANRKAPGPDLVRIEMLRLRPALFVSAMAALWTAVSRVGHMPSLLTSGWLVPVFKEKGDR